MECVEHLCKLLKGDIQTFVPFGFILASATCSGRWNSFTMARWAGLQYKPALAI
ncbi:uncharacterized protein L969DRAFT_83700 [Mixia osmundae IAM 14324]|uniref:uncharacterized protein n=1 Tax=Mixia osmundae (strain CBS 9802 / IAM 14324 / JCM 22182 / KY 12970) TaxID=764103 RepID=UPI0004A54D06|nr:uncharacterized protein L969DRAFT_83700 [Mixia osmundae IAM 14324]KEI41862.1 hypothetical protein L969DRAFT_83700 [Mixia osmundae IAM 14324]